MKKTRFNLLNRERTGLAPHYEKRAGITPNRVSGILWLIMTGILAVWFAFFKDVNIIKLARGNVLLSALLTVVIALYFASMFLFRWSADSWDDFRMRPVFKVLGVTVVIFSLVMAFLGFYLQ